MKRGFVYCVCGNEQVARVNRSLQFIKRFTTLDIVVAKARAFIPIYHDQVIECRVPDEFTNQAATTSLKTDLHRMLPTESAEWCYLDSNVIAVDKEIDLIFGRRGPAGFPRDSAEIDSQSPNVAGCGCRSRQCRHLRQAIREAFSVRIASGTWIPWRTGVFVFGQESVELLDLWHQNAVSVMSEARWSGRDQWALAAAVWKLGYQDKAALPRRFCRVVDGFRGIPPSERDNIPPSQLVVDNSYSLAAAGNRKPAFLHFVSGAAGAAGWKNWDDAARLIGSNGDSPAAAPTTVTKSAPDPIQGNAPAIVTRRRGTLTAVHGMWIGSSLSRMELLTLRSFVQQGHRFHLWAYDQITTPIPDGVVLEDATEILPRKAIFKRRAVDERSGVGAGSYGAPFSDLFRYKLLHDKGGYWADMDVTCLKPFPSDTPYLFRSHRIGVVGNIMKCPRGSRLMRETYEQTLRSANEDSAWLLPNQILAENVKRLGLSRYIRTNFCNPDSWPDVVQPFIENDYAPPGEWYAIHWLNEVWRTLSQNGGLFKGRPMLKYKVDKDQPKEGTTLARLYETHGLSSSWRFAANGQAASRDAASRGAASGGAASRGAAFAQSQNGSGNNGSGRPARARLAWRNHINVLAPTLAVGGAERIVVDTLNALAEARPRSAEPGHSVATLFVIDDAEPAYSGEISGVETLSLASLSRAGACELVAGRVLRSGTPTLFVHLGDGQLLKTLWKLGVRTIPVVHNTSPGWPAPAAMYNHPNVPFVVAVCETVARELREYGCLKRIVVVRHEVAPPQNSDANAEARRKVRARHGISDDTFLVGMVGQFKRQKNYPKAVHVLAALRKLAQAKLMILGPWDHTWGDGREVFAETYRTACDLNVVADLITPGAVMDVEEYYPAFDVMLSTSEYEGLSISMMEAASRGCPVVSSEVGGAAEIAAGSLTLLPKDAAPEVYADAIMLAAGSAIPPSTAPVELDLIPELWNLLGQFGDPDTYQTDTLRSACVVDCVAGARIKTVQRLAAVAGVQYVMSMGSVDSNCERALRSQGVQIYDVDRPESAVYSASSILRVIQEIGISTLYVAGVDCKVRLLLAKVLPPERIVIYDPESTDALFQKMALDRDFQRRIVFDESAYFRRISPWPRSCN
jgi:glycosyltransferase involved in cell wall biosynthesis